MKHNHHPKRQNFMLFAWRTLTKNRLVEDPLHTFHSLFLAIILATCALSSFASQSGSSSRPEIQSFITEMVSRHEFNQNELETTFNQVRFQPGVLKLISAPATAISWNEYQSRFVNVQRIRGGVDFWNKHANALVRAKEVYGIPEEIIVAIIGVETAYGTSTGNHRVIDALTTLAFDFPRRADFFREELEHYLLLAREQDFDPLSLKGSYAGAIGIPQFMPGSYRRYAIDFDNDGKINLSANSIDAIGSVGNYLKQYGWELNQPIVMRAHVTTEEHLQEILDAGIEPLHTVEYLRKVGIVPMDAVSDQSLAALIELTDQGKRQLWLGFKNFYVITRYNRSTFYAMSVFKLAEAIRTAKYASQKR